MSKYWDKANGRLDGVKRFKKKKAGQAIRKQNTKYRNNNRIYSLLITLKSLYLYDGSTYATWN